MIQIKCIVIQHMTNTHNLFIASMASQQLMCIRINFWFTCIKVLEMKCHIFVVAQRCIPTIFDVEGLLNLTLNNDADVSNTTTITELGDATLRDIEDGTV